MLPHHLTLYTLRSAHHYYQFLLFFINHSTNSYYLTTSSIFHLRVLFISLNSLLSLFLDLYHIRDTYIHTKMEKKQNIVQYRERLEKTLSSFDLTNDQKLKQLVTSQLLRSAQFDIQGCDKKVEIKTAEVSNILDMMRSVSAYDTEGSSTSRADWKLKQDGEEFRVMYREGPEGTPFHTLMVEGYVDGPVDVGLSLAWESPLYKKWWPQFTIPTFKVTASNCLQKIQTGEQMSLVRMKPPWPLSTREAIVHYYLLEYFQDDLIIVLLKTVHDSKSDNGTIDGVNNDAIPEAKDVVRIDVVGGIVLQKVTSERSYFRAIANLDIKLDFVPPSLINFMSRQLIGSGFRLYQKAVASKMNNDKEFSKALGDPLYVRIREALYNINGSNAMDKEVLKQVASILPAEELSQSKQDGVKDIYPEDQSNQNANNYNGETLDEDIEAIAKADSEEIVQIEKDFNKVHEVPIEKCETWNSEIVDADSEEIEQIEKDVKKIHHIPVEDDDDTRSVLKSTSNVSISSEVKQALGTLERAISAVRKLGFHSRRFSFTFANVETRYIAEKGDSFDSNSAKLIQLSVKNEVGVDVSNNNTLQETSDEFYEIQNLSFRHTGTNPNSKEVNYNKVVPASPEEKLMRSIEASHVGSHSLRNETTLDQTIRDNKQLNIDADEDMSSDVPKQLSKRKKYRYCCFLH